MTLNIHLANFYKHAHIIYKDLYNNPPSNVKYIPTYPYWHYLKKYLLGKMYSPIQITKSININLIHSLGQLLNTTNNWISSIEHQFIYSERDFEYLSNSKFKNKINKIVLSENCKAILALTKTAKKSLENYHADNDIAKKIDYCYPSIDFGYLQSIPEKSFEKKINLLFIANNDFYIKGGKEIFEIMRILQNKKHKFHLIVKCNNIPAYIKSTYSNLNIELIDQNLSFSEIRSLYEKSHFFLFPVKKSSFGVFLEAFAFGLPVITTNVFEIPEIVQNGTNGYSIDSKYNFFSNDFSIRYKSDVEFRKKLAISEFDKHYVEQAVDKIINLVENVTLYKKISHRNFIEVTEGKFSNQSRNTKLLNVYKKFYNEK